MDTEMAVPGLDPNVAPNSSSSTEWAFLGLHCGATPTMPSRALRSGHVTLKPPCIEREYITHI